MAAKKIYAVRAGRKTGIFKTWAECRQSVDGFSQAEYRGFESMEEARAYLGLSAVEKMDGPGETESGRRQDQTEPGRESLIAYVDGSYDHSIRKYAFGCVFLLPDGQVYAENGNGDNPESAALRNVTGEMLGAMYATRFAIANGFQKLEIRYDYEGIEKWVTGVWRSKTELTQKYAKAMQSWSKAVSLTFTKVAAHTNVYYNEMADQLAKAALLTAKGVPPIRRIEEMEPGEYGADKNQ